MLFPVNLRQKLKNREKILSAMLRFPLPELAEVMALSGVECIIVDNEHYAFDDQNLVGIVRACTMYGASALIRPTDLNFAKVSRYLDFGFQGILAAHVEDAETACNIVNAVKFGPEGERGFCPISRSSLYGYAMPADEFARISNEETVVIAMIETKSGVENIDPILEVSGIDAITIGPSDMSNSYGFPGKPDHPVVRAAIEEVENKVLALGKPLFVQAYTVESAKKALDRGMNMLNIGSDLQILITGFNKLVSEIKTL
jgi:4-hydroxy-2-oxoheptanedioate aldolase